MEIIKDHRDVNTKTLLDELTKRFFNAFTVKVGQKVSLDILHQLFIPEGIIVKNVSDTPEIYTLRQFIEPREKMLNEGTLINFKEEELMERTEMFGTIAHRFSLYQKSGILSGKAFLTKGMKTIQFIKTPLGWRISALAWDDEKDGLTIPEKYKTK